MIQKAPWTDEEVDRLNAYQQSCEFHPYTCPGNLPGCEHRCNLVATCDGWLCQCGEYKQGWVHADMARHDPVAQRTERRSSKSVVAGSSPAGVAILPLIKQIQTILSLALKG